MNDQFDTLISSLHDYDPEKRRHAASALGRMQDERAVSYLIELLKDSVPNVRFTAAAGLGQIGDPLAVSYLVKLLTSVDKHDTAPRRVVVWALGQIGDVHASSALLAILHDPADGAYYDAAIALGRMGDRRSIAPLKMARTHIDSGIREEAARLLQTLKD
jgi:HEAT repeat protein